VIQTIESFVRRKPNQHFIDSPKRTNRALLEAQVRSPNLDCRIHHIGRRIEEEEEEEEISSLPSVANEKDLVSDFEFSPRSKSLILVQTTNQDKIHDTL